MLNNIYKWGWTTLHWKYNHLYIFLCFQIVSTSFVPRCLCVFWVKKWKQIENSFASNWLYLLCLGKIRLPFREANWCRETLPTITYTPIIPVVISQLIQRHLIWFCCTYKCFVNMHISFYMTYILGRILFIGVFKSDLVW